MKHLLSYSIAGLMAISSAVLAQNTAEGKKVKAAKKQVSYHASVPAPTLSGVRYGAHERNVLDFWRAESDAPTPLVFVIHGGGWVGGSKERLDRFADTAALLEAGISVVAINYRFTRQAAESGVEPPVKAPLHDAARALQFVRSMAGDWNVDKERIGAAGGSAGACSSLWLAYHDDLADPKSNDPIARESSRLWCAAVTGAQTSLDPKQMRDWTPNSRYGGHAFGLRDFAQFHADRDNIMPWIKEYSPYALVSADDPSVYLIYSRPPALGQEEKDPTHTANFGLKLQEHCAAIGVDCDLVYPGATKVNHETPTDYLIATLKREKKSDWIQLFNGEDLTGWTPKIRYQKLGEDPRKTFRVENGVIKVGYENYDKFNENFGHLFFKTPHSKYRLRVEYRFLGDQMEDGPGWAFRNSGLMLHGQDPKTMHEGQDFPDSIEVQLLGGSGKGKRATLNLCTPGTDVVMNGKLLKNHCINSESETYHGDQWVTAEVWVDGSNGFKHIIDGKVVLEYQSPQLDDGTLLEGGTISLQSESHPCEFRKVELLLLD
jgi:acetyl esterase/lipase